MPHLDSILSRCPAFAVKDIYLKQEPDGTERKAKAECRMRLSWNDKVGAREDKEYDEESVENCIDAHKGCAPYVVEGFPVEGQNSARNVGKVEPNGEHPEEHVQAWISSLPDEEHAELNEDAHGPKHSSDAVRQVGKELPRALHGGVTHLEVLPETEPVASKR